MSLLVPQLLHRHGLALLIGVLVLGLLGVIGIETRWGSNMRPATVLIAGQGSKNGDT